MLELVYLICFSSCVGLKVAVQRIVGGKWGACSGQACIGIDYVLVEDQFKSNLVIMLDLLTNFLFILCVTLLVLKCILPRMSSSFR